MTTDTRTTVVLRRDTVVTLRRMATEYANAHGGHVNVSAIVQGIMDNAFPKPKRRAEPKRRKVVL